MAIVTTHGYELHQARTTTPAPDPSPERPVDPAGITVTPVSLPDDAEAALISGDWATKAMCTDKTAIFFAPPGERDGRRRRREALACAYCSCCSVKEICLLAGRQGREHGIWGGETDEERAAAGFAPRSPHRRAVAAAARDARRRADAASA